jgi:hypothetical protein
MSLEVARAALGKRGSELARCCLLKRIQRSMSLLEFLSFKHPGLAAGAKLHLTAVAANTGLDAATFQAIPCPPGY